MTVLWLFLAAQSSSRSQAVCWLVTFVKKWPLEYQKVIKTYLPTYLWNSCDSSDSNDSSDSSEQNNVFTRKLFYPFFFNLQKNFLQRIFFHQKKLKLK